MKTYTPELGPEVLGRLRDYALLFAADSPHARPALWAPVYLRGLLLDGERTRSEPPSGRVALPAGLAVTGPDQALQPFVNQGPWQEAKVLERYRSVPAGAFASPAGVVVFDDAPSPKQGRHSVGVHRPYCGAWGKKANGRVAVSVPYGSPEGPYPLGRRLYRPDGWLHDPARLDKAGVPHDQRRALAKPEVALGLRDRVRGEGLPGGAVVADGGYGVGGGLP